MLLLEDCPPLAVGTALDAAPPAESKQPAAGEGGAAEDGDGEHEKGQLERAARAEEVNQCVDQICAQVNAILSI